MEPHSYREFMQFLNEREEEYSKLYRESSAQVNQKYYLHAVQAVRELRRRATLKWQK
jgi:hypothetical protein